MQSNDIFTLGLGLTLGGGTIMSPYLLIWKELQPVSGGPFQSPGLSKQVYLYYHDLPYRCSVRRYW